MFAQQTDLERFRALRHLRSLTQRLAEHPELDVWLSDRLWRAPTNRHEQRIVDKTLNTLGQTLRDGRRD